LQQELDQLISRGDIGGSEWDEVCEWSPAVDDASIADEDRLCVGMAVQLNALKAKTELNGRRGTLIKFDVERDRWQVDLGIDIGIKLFKSCNLNPCMDVAADLDAGGLQTHGGGHEPIRHINDLDLPCSEEGIVDWVKVFPDFCNDFFDLQRQNKFCCSKCGVDISSAPGASGCAAYMTSAGM